MIPPHNPTFPRLLARPLQIALAVLLTAGLIPSSVTAGGPADCKDDVWLISTRALSKRRCLYYWRLHNRQWVGSSKEEFLAGSVPGVPMCFWVHGWRITHADAKEAGLRTYYRLRGFASRPVRFVIWSWPSHQTGPLLQDAREKAHLADAGAYPLAWLIDQIHPDVPVSLIGFSLGARLSSGALHLLGGGGLAGCQPIPRLHPVRAPLRGALLAGAMDNVSLAVGQRNSQSLPAAERLLVTVNDTDNVLKWYPLLQHGWNGPQAIGYTGSYGYLGPHYHKLEQLYVAHLVGREHHWDPYVDNAPIAAAISDLAFFDDSVAPLPPPEPPLLKRETKRHQANRSQRARN